MSETQGGSEQEAPPKPVDDPDLPVEGDPEDFDEEPVADEDFNDEIGDESQLDEPNDLSGIDKEFED